MRERFKTKRFSDASTERIGLCNQIIEDYLGQGLRLTLRQLYYQLVIRNAIRNLARPAAASRERVPEPDRARRSRALRLSLVAVADAEGLRQVVGGEGRPRRRPGAPGT